MKYVKFNYDLSQFDTDDVYDYLKLPCEDGGEQKVLFVLDYVPSEDLHSGKLLSGETGDLLESLVSTCRRFYGKGKSKFSWMACNFNAMRTAGKSSEFRDQAEAAFADRLQHIIKAYKPDYVVTFGRQPTKALIGHKLVNSDKGIKYSHWLGVPVKVTIKGHECEVISSFSLNSVIRGESAEASLLGYMMRNLTPLFGVRYHIDSAKIDAHKSILISDIDQFKWLMKKIKTQSVVAIDTETRNLNRINNSLLTVQFAYDQSRGFCLPINHKDTPFTPKELKYIGDGLRDYFEGDNENEYHVYTNAKFDLNIMREALNIETFHNDVWDILGGEFGLDENLKALDVMLGEYYYSLGNLSVQYGCESYLTAEFSKQHRANFYAADLTPEVVKYTTYDCVIPLAIHEQQKKRASDIAYKRYDKVVVKEISNTIHAFSKMEHTGALLDTNYLFFLRTENSPIEQEIKRQYDHLLSTPQVKKANSILSKGKGIPTKGLFDIGGESGIVFNLNKPDHRKLLFFDVMKLEPLEVGKSVKGANGIVKEGSGKLDKAFQNKYADIPEVAAFTALSKSKKLRDAFVKSFIKKLKEDEDLQKTKRVRPTFSFLKVVTHRTSAADPNLQQVPAHSKLGKNIKRLFVARPGCLIVKVDYRVHEVRGWGLISYDKNVASVFLDAKKLRDEYRLHPTKELAKRVKTEADVHVQNASYFFSVKLDAVVKTLRNAVKAVIFGLIYQKSIPALAKDISQDIEYTKKLVGNFRKRFPKGMKWIEDIKESVARNFYVEAPTGIRRNLWAFLLPESLQQAEKIKGQATRQAVNSPIQGMCSKMMMTGIRVLDKAIFEIHKTRKDFGLYINNSVHDSLENEAKYGSFIKSLGLIEKSMTTDLRTYLMEEHGFDIVVDLEIDFELGADLRHCDGWDFSLAQLDRMVMDSIIYQRNELRHKVVVADAYREVFDAFDKDAAPWMKQQKKNLGYEFNMTEVKYIKMLFKEAEDQLDVGNALLKSAEKIKDEKEKAEQIKKANGIIEEATGVHAYASELTAHYKQYKKRIGHEQ